MEVRPDEYKKEQFLSCIRNLLDDKQNAKFITHIFKYMHVFACICTCIKTHTYNSQENEVAFKTKNRQISKINCEYLVMLY